MQTHNKKPIARTLKRQVAANGDVIHIWCLEDRCQCLTFVNTSSSMVYTSESAQDSNHFFDSQTQLPTEILWQVR